MPTCWDKEGHLARKGWAMPQSGGQLCPPPLETPSPSLKEQPWEMDPSSKTSPTYPDTEDTRTPLPTEHLPWFSQLNDWSSVTRGAATETANRKMTTPCHPTTLEELLSLVLCQLLVLVLCVPVEANEQPPVSFLRSHLPPSSLI